MRYQLVNGMLLPHKAQRTLSFFFFLFDCQIDFWPDIFSLTFPLHYNDGNYTLTFTLTQTEVQAVSHTLPHSVSQSALWFTLTFQYREIFLGVTFSEGSRRITMGVGREVRGVMIYFSLERWDTFITRNKKPVALFELWMLVLLVDRQQHNLYWWDALQ